MAVPGVLTEYIAKNYKRLLICVAPPATNSDSDDNEFHSAVSQLQSAAPEQPQETDNQHDVVNHHDEQPSHVSRRRRRRSTLTRSRRARRRRDAQGRYVYVQDGQQLVRGSFSLVCPLPPLFCLSSVAVTDDTFIRVSSRRSVSRVRCVPLCWTAT